MVILNMVMKFHNFEMLLKLCYIFDLSSALACRVESIKNELIWSNIIHSGVIPSVNLPATHSKICIMIVQYYTLVTVPLKHMPKTE